MTTATAGTGVDAAEAGHEGAGRRHPAGDLRRQAPLLVLQGQGTGPGEGQRHRQVGQVVDGGDGPRRRPSRAAPTPAPEACPSSGSSRDGNTVVSAGVVEPTRAPTLGRGRAWRPGGAPPEVRGLVARVPPRLRDRGRRRRPALGRLGDRLGRCRLRRLGREPARGRGRSGDPGDHRRVPRRGANLAGATASDLRPRVPPRPALHAW